MSIVEQAMFMPSLGWDTAIGAIGFIIVAFICWRVFKKVNKEKNISNEIDSRKSINDLVNKMKEDGMKGSDILKELIRIRKNKLDG